MNVAISGRHSVTTRARSSIVMPTPPPVVGCTIASQRSPMPASTSLNSPRSALGFPVDGSRTWMCTIAAPAACASTALSHDLLRRDRDRRALRRARDMPPVIAQEKNTGLHGRTITLSAPSTRSVNVAVGLGEVLEREAVGDQLRRAGCGRRRRARSPRGISPAAARTPTTSISSSTSRCSGIARVLHAGSRSPRPGRPCAPCSTHWPSAAGSPEHSSATSAPRPPVRSRIASTGSLGGEVDGLVPELGRLREPRAAARPRSPGRRRARARTRPPAAPSRPARPPRRCRPARGRRA